MRFFALWALGVALVSGPVTPRAGEFRMTVCLRPDAGATRELTIQGIEVFRRVLDTAEPGMAIGLLGEGIERADAKQGDMLAAGCD